MKMTCKKIRGWWPTEQVEGRRAREAAWSVTVMEVRVGRMKHVNQSLSAGIKPHTGQNSGSDGKYLLSTLMC